MKPIPDFDWERAKACPHSEAIKNGLRPSSEWGDIACKECGTVLTLASKPEHDRVSSRVQFPKQKQTHKTEKRGNVLINGVFGRIREGRKEMDEWKNGKKKALVMAWLGLLMVVLFGGASVAYFMIGKWVIGSIYAASALISVSIAYISRGTYKTYKRLYDRNR